MGRMVQEALLVLRTKVAGGQGLDRLQKQLGGIEGAAKRSRSAFTGVINSASWQAAAVAAVGIGAGLASSIKVAKEFEKSMSGVESKLGGTPEQMAAIQAKAKDLGRQTAFTASQVGDAMEFLAMAGFDANEVLSATPAMLDLAIAGKTDLATTADIVSDALGAFGLEAGKATMAADVMAAASASGNTSIVGLGEALKYTAPPARDFGAGIAEVSAMVSVLGDAGVKASQAGTGLRAIFIRLAAPPKKAAEALDYLGVKTTDAAGNMRPMETILGDINTAMTALNLGEKERIQVLSDLAGRNAVTSLSNLVYAESTGALRDRIDEVTNSQGAAAKMAGIMGDNLDGAMKRLGSAVEGLQLALIGSADGGALQIFVDGLASLINKVTDFAEAFPAATAAIVALSAAFAALVALAPFIAAFLSVVGSIAGAFKGLGAAIAGLKLAAVVAGWAGAVLPTLAAIGGAFKALLAIVAGVLAGPAGWIALIAAAVAAIYTFREPIASFFGWVGEQFATWIASLWEWGAPVREFWVGLWNGAQEAALGFFSWIADALVTNLVEPWLAVGGLIADALASTWEVIKGPILGFFAWWGGILYQLYVEPWLKSMELLGKIAAAAWKTIKDGSEFLWTAFRVATDSAVRWFAEQVERYIVAPFEAAVIQVARTMGGLWSQIQAGAGAFWGWLSGQVQTYVVGPFVAARDQIAAAWGDFSAVIAQGLTSVGQFFFDNVIVPIQGAWVTLVNWFGSTGERIGQALRAGFDAIAGGIAGAFQSTVEGVVDLINKVIGLINKAVGALNRLRAAGGMSQIAEVGTVAVPAFASGGFVTKPTLGLVGEGSDDEYIIPASKMAGASAAFLSGRRGTAVLSGGAAGSAAAAGAVNVSITTGPVVQMDGRSYVTVEDLQAAGEQIAAQVYAGLRGSAGRRAVGLA